MSLPTNGWLDESVNTGGIPFEGPLPEEYTGQYFEGGDGVLLGQTEIDFLQIAIIFELSFIRERFGYSMSPGTSEFARTLTIQLVQAEVFGVLLIDSFTPPNIANEFFEFAAYVQAACDGGLSGSTPLFGPCKTGEDVVAEELVGAATSYSEES